MLSCLVMQDAEDAAAEKANAAAIRAASISTSAHNAEGQGGWSQTPVARSGAGRKSEAMRKEKGKDRGRTKDKGREIGGGGYYGVLGERDGRAGEIDEEAFVKELLAGGAHTAGLQSQNRSGKSFSALSVEGLNGMLTSDRNRRQHDPRNGDHARRWQARTHRAEDFILPFCRRRRRRRPQRFDNAAGLACGARADSASPGHQRF
jgi:hypothetical protein